MFPPSVEPKYICLHGAQAGQPPKAVALARRLRHCKWCAYETADASNMNRHNKRMHEAEFRSLVA